MNVESPVDSFTDTGGTIILNEQATTIIGQKHKLAHENAHPPFISMTNSNTHIESETITDAYDYALLNTSKLQIYGESIYLESSAESLGNTSINRRSLFTIDDEYINLKHAPFVFSLQPDKIAMVFETGWGKIENRKIGYILSQGLSNYRPN